MNMKGIKKVQHVLCQAHAGLNFGEKSIRRGFIRKVYSILSLQLLVTGGMIAYFVFLLPQQYQSPICQEVSVTCSKSFLQRHFIGHL